MCFSVQEQVEGGTPFAAGDRAALTGNTVELSCVRNFDDAAVLWEILDNEGTVIDTLYDSNNPKNLPNNYEFTNGDPVNNNDFTILITVVQETSIFTKCTILGTDETHYISTSETAMIFAIGW